MIAPLSLPVAPDDWMHTFHPFTAMHFITLGLLMAIIIGACLVGRAWRGTKRERGLRVIIVAFTWLVMIASNTYYLWPSHFKLSESLPLQFCDLAIVIAAIALQTQWRWARALLYYDGMMLSIQGFLTPTLIYGPEHPRFWLFWLLHACIIGPALYDIIALHFRPTLRDLGFALICSYAYAACILPFDIVLHVNYGYMGDSRPDRPTILDALGAWPLRIVWIALIGTAVVTAGWAIWPLSRMLAGKPPRADAQPQSARDA